MSNSYTFQILDSNNLVSAAIEASIAIDAQYVIGLVSRYISWNGTMDFVVEIRPGSELTWSDADGLLPSFVQLGWTGSAWTNQTIAEARTGFDPNPNRPDAGLTIYLADDGTIRNDGAPVWFDPNPGFGVNPAVPSGSHDFVGILTHEIFHSLGFINYTQEWAAQMVAAGDISYFTGARSAALYGGAIPFRTGFDHYGYAQDPSIPINRGLMYEFGNYELNRWDIGRIDLAMLADMGYSIKTYDGLSLFEMVDTATDLTGTAAGETLYGDYHSNTLLGLGGNDRIEAGAGPDHLSGGDGNDLLIGGAGIDSFDGGANTASIDPVTVYGDRISFAEPTATQSVVADLRTGTISNDGFGNAETMTGIESLGAGTVFADTFHGNDSRNALLGSKGDVLNGHGGDDIIQITAAPASVAGGAGADLLELFSAGGFYLPDGNGDGIPETAQAMANPWSLDLALGTIRDGYFNSGTIAGIENVNASAVGGDIFGDDNANVFKGREGVDILLGRGGDDILEGGDAADQLSGGAGNDIVRGGAGSDDLTVGGAGADVAEGGAGNWDRLIVDYGDSAGSIAMTMPGADAGGGSAGSISGADRSLSYSGVEIFDVTTGSGDDVVWGGTDNSAFPGAGNVFRLGGGDDLFHYRGGTDTVDAGTGVDGFSGSLGANGFQIVWTLEPTLFPGTHSIFRNFEYFQSLTTGNGQDHITTANIDADDNVTLGTNGDGVILWNGHDTVNGGAAGAGAIDSGLDTLILNYGQSTSAVRNVWALVAGGAGYSGRFGDDGTRSATFTAIDRFLIATGSGADSIATGDGNDEIRTGGGNDVVSSGGGRDYIDGGSGDDSMTGGTGDDTYVVSSAGDVVLENSGEGTDQVRTALATYVLAANVEELIATSAVDHDFRGNSGNNLINAGGGSDVLRLYDGGDDIVLAGAGNDTLFFIGSLTAADTVNAGDGVDTLVLQGPYGSLALSPNVILIENVSILGGNNTSFGEPGTNRYDYVLTTNDANFAAGVQARINGAALLEDEDFTFDGSAETDAKYVVYGGKGRDTLTGGLGNDIFFYAEERFASGDVVNGGSGYDGMFLRGNYTIDFTAPGYTGLFTSIENLTLTSATDERYARGGGTEFDYDLTLSDAIVKPGEQLTISGTLLMASETMILDASQELDGLLRLFGGKAGDTLKGGGQADLLYGGMGADILAGNGGADAFRYQDVAESNSGSMDQILDFTAGTDKIELDRIDADTLVGGDQGFSWIGSNAFSGTAGQLRAYQQGGTWFVEGDVNGDSVADLVIALTLQGPTPLSAGDFLL